MSGLSVEYNAFVGIADVALNSTAEGNIWNSELATTEELRRAKTIKRKVTKMKQIVIQKSHLKRWLNDISIL